MKHNDIFILYRILYFVRPPLPQKYPSPVHVFVLWPTESQGCLCDPGSGASYLQESGGLGSRCTLKMAVLPLQEFNNSQYFSSKVWTPESLLLS